MCTGLKGITMYIDKNMFFSFSLFVNKLVVKIYKIMDSIERERKALGLLSLILKSLKKVCPWRLYPTFA